MIFKLPGDIVNLLVFKLMGAIALSYPLFFLMIYFEEMQLNPNYKPPYPKGGMKVQQWQLMLKTKCKSINFFLYSPL